ncbi:DUF6710 family protein [Clostridium felsineum]|uniref:Uncharacterized protein n=1 Tax=Clostridium felsineum TaxID=36839 RepID=A0A1S8KZP5_9CLOT|nr:DUF6710 family protein [Clostridium felsineum]URZ06505.1 hypothetical protein CLROS_018380 [Clostridium felsineum]URZ11540.1 hypothetical protein CROST_022570 [Clostridium felsineum]
MMLNLFRKSKELKEKKCKFNSAVKFANSVLNEFNNSLMLGRIDTKDVQTHPLIDVVRLLGRRLQTQYLSYLLFTEESEEVKDITVDEIMFSISDPLTQNDETLYNLISKVDIKRNVHLKNDLVLPWPWKRERLIRTIAYIGEGKKSGKWKQDFQNHFVQLWLPLGIAWVNGGNHSIAEGIVQGEGVIEVNEIYDISPLYKYVFCDGLYYRRIYDNSIISPVKNVEFAAIFEIGRIMIKNSISF